MLSVAIAASALFSQPTSSPYEYSQLAGSVVPDTHSVTLCPSAESAFRMLNQYYRPGSSIIDTNRYFEGLRATGCQQRAGPVLVRQIVQTRHLQFVDRREAYIAFRGEAATGQQVHGIVDVEAFRQRTPLEEFLLLNGHDGRVSTDQGTSYVCPTVDAARRVIQGTPETGRAPEAVRQRTFNTLIGSNNCTRARDDFRVTAIFERTDFEDGFEGYSYQAVSVRSSDGAERGLLYLLSM